MSNDGVGKTHLRLLHTSDLHIGNDISAADAFRGFEAVLNKHVELAVDAILVAGDLFDNGRISDTTINRTMSELGAIGKPVIVVPGNHDTILTEGRLNAATPANVTIINEAQGEMVLLRELGLAVWGRPVYDHAPEFKPLAGMPERPTEGWYVSMAHGLFMEPPVDPLRSSPILPDEIERAPCDYVALGHVHVFRDVSRNGVPAFYSGAPSGPQRRTVALVELHPSDGVTVSPIELP